jgi:chromosome partitioning protein
LLDGTLTDWVVVRNRLSTLGSRNKRRVGEGLDQLALQLGFRCADGFSERVVYREMFPRGLTALDDLSEATLGTRPNMSHLGAREEVTALIAALRLPVDERGRRRVAARAAWSSAADRPIELDEIVTE